MLSPSFKRIGVVACDPNLLIGDKGCLPWRILEELVFFRKTTYGYPIVMGRNTAEMGLKNVPLPHRTNLVLTSKKKLPHGFIPCKDFEDVDRYAWNHYDYAPYAKMKYRAILFIGGAELFRTTYPHLDSIQISRIKRVYDGDIYLPPLPSYFEYKKTLYPSEDFSVDFYARQK